jgi:hypothetical protein
MYKLGDRITHAKNLKIIKNLSTMKAIKITLLLALLFAGFTSCTEQELNDDTMLTQEEGARKLPFQSAASDTGADIDD